MKDRNSVDKKQNEHDQCAGTIIYMGNIDFSSSSAALCRVKNNAKIFEALGYRVVFFGTAKNASFEGVRRSDRDDRSYEEAYPAGTLSWVRHTFSAGNIRLLAERFSDLRLIITYNIPFASFRAIKNSFRHSGVKLAYDCTEWSNYTDGSLWKRLYKKFDLFELICFLPRICGNMIAVSSMIEERYRKRNTLRLPPLVDISDPIWRLKRQRTQDEFTFCYSAATFENKDSPDTLIRAFGSLEARDVRLTVIGLDQDEALKQYPAIADFVGADDRISFTGRLSHEETIQRLLTADCFVFFREKNRRNEAGFPTKFVEAYTCPITILTNNTGDLSEYADGRRVIVIENASADAVKDRLARISARGKQMSGMIDATFDYHQYIDRTREWINRLY